MIVLAWAAVLIAAYFIGLRRIAREQAANLIGAENRRWLLLLAAALFLLPTLTRAGMHVDGDGGWYGTMLTDMIALICADASRSSCVSGRRPDSPVRFGPPCSRLPAG